MPKTRTRTTPQELEKTIETLKRTYPLTSGAMQMFSSANEWYQASIKALYGSQVSWSTATNGTGLQAW